MRGNNRIIYLDVIRVVAAIMVVAIHTTGYFLLQDDGGSTSLNLSHYICRCAVPLFFMVSGTVWLPHDTQISYSRMIEAIVRLFLIYFVWNFVYAIIFDYGSYSLFGILKHTWKGHFHMWFFEYLIGTYLLIPILKPIVHYKNGKLLPYFSGLFIVFGILLPTINNIPFFNEEIRLITGKVHYELIGFSGYFVVGYWLHSLKQKFNSLALIGVFLLAVATHYFVTDFFGMLFANTDSFSVFVFLEACSLFLLIKNFAGETTSSPILKLSNATLGVYLVHPLFLEKMPWTWLNVYPVCGAWFIMTIIILLMSFSFTIILKKIPIIKKWMV